jgi:hypothetical protein
MAIIESPEQARAQRPDDGRVATRDVGNPGEATIIEAGSEQPSS